ncbi:MAG: pyridoxamine 5'-phosphate oxidase family protein [Candidatus Caldarchaeum sp.]
MWWTRDVLQPVQFEQVRRYVDNQFFMRFATVSRRGRLHNAPCNFIRIDDRIYFDADEASIKIQNIKWNPNVCLVWNSGKPYFDSRGVIMQGHATIVNDMQLEAAVYEAINEKSFAGLRPSYTQYREKQRYPRVIVEVSPLRTFRWHFERLTPLKNPAER